VTGISEAGAESVVRGTFAARHARESRLN